MRTRTLTVLLAMVVVPGVHVARGHAAGAAAEVNPSIDADEFLHVAARGIDHRRSRRVSEEQFLRMSREPNTVVLDARSRDKYAELHVTGALNLPFPDITYASLARLIPRKDTRILIYCNNNFKNAEDPFPRKAASAALNLSTYVSLYDYGYRNVYELAPLRTIEESRLPLESSAR
jgi:hypothetical protein